MIVLNATPELKLTFDKLIRTMEVNVNWNGLFVVIDNTLILQGDVRSLFFHFDSRKVVTNIIDLEIPVHKITPIENNAYVKNVINMILYAFGKWGNIKGLTVEKDYAQLGRLFRNILGEMGIEPEYNKEHFWFYQKGVRILYEDVVECAVSYKEKDPEIPAEESRGLWHKLVWKQCFEEFALQRTTLKEQNRNRLGHNFYLTGYQCPACRNKMHGVVYPVGKEFIIDTDEGRVQLTRAYTCENCNCFYTPRPDRLLVDGDCYLMDFENDKAAYLDYQELLGENGARVSNPNYNSYVDRKRKERSGGVNAGMEKNKEQAADIWNAHGQRKSDEWVLAEFREMTDKLQELPEREFETFLAKVEEGFYPEKAVLPVESRLWSRHEKNIQQQKNMSQQKQKTLQTDNKNNRTDNGKVKRYRMRLELFPRLSQRQRQELIKQIADDAELAEDVREELLDCAEQLKRQDNHKKLKERITDAKNKNRLVMLRVYGEIEEADLEEADREELFGQTGVSYGEYEAYLAEKEENGRTGKPSAHKQNEGHKGTVRKEPIGNKGVSQNETDYRKEEQAIEKSKLSGKFKIRKERKKNREESKAVKEPKRDRKPEQDKKLERDKKSEWNKTTKQDKKPENDREAEILAIEEMIRTTKSAGRTELQQLLDNLFSQGFDAETLAPYEEHVRAQIRRLDETYLDSILGDIEQLSSEEGAEIYEQIAGADILPELKANALKQLETRLSKMKTDECELLVQKLKKQMTEAGLKEQQRHHYYPAKRVLLKEAAEEETAVIEYAVASYGAGIGAFEYPIWAADTSLKQTGGRGMFLTPEKLYYSNLTTSYHIPVPTIERIEAVTALLGRGLYVYRKDGEKIKLPYAVETGELPALAEVLDAFVKYLQEKPFSRKEAYLAQEKHEEICCFRCGYVYTGTDTCPKCGYKANK